ncbi:hypothetical protein COY32_00260 [candidate division WWE3 bacterium CG_4_10_14_0_2_um_filter_41_14]|uniref:Uncharacterized protein n=1 Tax=candidate division WWE3 bacterium CG_4_10_14_0_2_um_filter_41_14 TaxID=1975072 RepID=A0A2M7TM13_UNCKA|nr:MAG: hypothetical protein COY32_00260 [candidate division WWE3 bacterium CG_4_10_14_0_2_um_filter_41_14]
MTGYTLRLNNLNLKDTRTRQYVGVGVTFLWVIVLVVFALVPSIRSAFLAQQLSSSEKAVEVALLANADKTRQAQSLLAQAKENEGLVHTAVPVTKKSVTTINEINLLAAKHGLAIKNLSLSGGAGSSSAKDTTTATGEVVSLGFALTVTGSYPQMRELIKEIEQLPRIIQLSSVDIGKAVSQTKGPGESTPSDSSELSASFAGTFYYSESSSVSAVSVQGSGQ